MIRIALTNLKKYNEGELIYEWVELPCEDLKSVFDRIGHDEYFISDYECDDFHITIHEYDCINKLNDLAKQIDDLTDYERKVLKAIMEADSPRIMYALEILKNDNYLFYEVEDFDELIDEFIDEGLFGEIPPNLVNYLDYEKIARDLEYDGFSLTSVGVINLS